MLRSKTKYALLLGVILYVTKKLASAQSELHEIVTKLGGEVRYFYTADVTHVVFTGKANDVTKEFKMAKADKKFIVAPDWVFMSRNEKKLMQVQQHTLLMTDKCKHKGV